MSESVYISDWDRISRPELDNWKINPEFENAMGELLLADPNAFQAINIGLEPKEVK